jgi:hypothetical protein
MYRKVHRIPTILGLFIIMIGITVGITLTRTSQDFSSQANVSAAPEDVHFTNITENSFTISWLTGLATTGEVSVSDGGAPLIYLDDLDNDNIPRPRLTHLTTVKNLKESVSYTVKIISGKEKCSNASICPSFTQTTGVKLANAPTIPPIRGSMTLKDGKPAEGAVVYVTVGKSVPLSSRVDAGGLWVIPLNNLRTQDFLSRPEIAGTDPVQITGTISPGISTTGVSDMKSILENLTIPKMQMGNSYNFINLQSKKDYFMALENNNQAVLGTSNTSPSPVIKNPSPVQFPITVLFPSDKSHTTTDRQPKIRGTAKPKSTLLITVNSVSQVGKVVVGADGTWTYRPPKELPPGTHHVTIQGIDQNGKAVTVTQEFIVFKSGEQVLGDATPSATLVPTNIPSATPAPSVTNIPLTPTATPTAVQNPSVTPSLTPTVSLSPTPTVIIYPTATISVKPPRSGSMTSTLLITSGSLLLLLSGVKFLFFP